MSHSLQSSAVLTTVFSVAQAAEAARAGAQIVDAGDDESLVSAIRHARVDVLVCGAGSAADVSRDTALAGPGGARLLCDRLSAAEQAAGAGIAKDRILVQVTPAGVGAASQAGWQVLVEVDDDATSGPGGSGTGGSGTGGAAAGARAAVCAWLGASVVSTRHVTQVRRCLDMADSIRGARPPAWAVRGLA
jgi:hypothetical protein